MMGNELLKVQNISVSYGKKQMIKNVSFALARGEFTALLGLNGSGKTTLLKAIGGLQKLDSGYCMIGEEYISGMSEKSRARHISYIPQRNSIVFDIPVLDVVLMGFNPSLRPFEVPGKKERQAALSILEKLGMEEYKNESFLHLSEGQKQIVILARAVAQNAPIMLFDEPDSSLDFVNRNMVLGKIREIIKKDCRCGLISIHSPNFALEYCDRIILLSEGRICADISVGDVDSTALQSTLSQIYGNVDILDYRGGRVMVSRRKEDPYERGL